jgi:hypothetical protein
MDADGEEVLGRAWDPAGREIVLLRRIWVGKILRDHRELAWALEDVLWTVHDPDAVRPAREPRRVRYSRAGAGPSRWLLVIVSFEQKPARIISAYGQRKDPGA